MKALILAAGYATRLFPLTINKSKSLLPICGEKTVIDFIIEKLEDIDRISQIIIVTNNKYITSFNEWLRERTPKKDIKIVNDGTSSVEDKLGAIGDIQFAIEKEQIEEDLLVLAGDNLFTFDISQYIDFFYEMDRDCILVKKTDSLKELQSIGVVELDPHNRVLSFEEKPEVPRSDIGVYALYMYQKETLKLIKEYLRTGNNPDSPSHFPEWLINHKEVMAYFGNGEIYDIGTHEALHEVRSMFSEIGENRDH
ncbi:MAG: hypothetical protein K0R46_3227 [Herbinix sp.]|jgi:glucose-1-phosphate thymidylyltransferase|nr:hypothetical protein [Herbinix sp.]